MAVGARDELVRALAARVRLFRLSMDRDAVLAPQAMGQVRELMRLVTDPAADPEAVRVIADLHRCRSVLLGEENGRQDAAIAAALARYAGPEEEASEAEETAVSARRLGALHTEAADRVAAAQRVRDPALLEEALRAARAAVDGTPVHAPPLRASALFLWGSALRTRYEREGDPRDLGEAISALRRAETGAGSGHPDLAAILSGLCGALRERYERTGALDDLLAAVRVARAAVAAGGETDRGGRLHNLGLALRQRHERTGDRSDLAEAVDAHREAVRLTPPGHRDHSLLRQGLANALRARYELGGDQADLQARVDALEAAVDAVQDSGETGADTVVPRYGAVLNLASALTERYETTSRDADAVRAERLLRAAEGAVPTRHPLHAAIQYQLGRVLGALGRDEAAARLRSAAFHPAAAPRLRLRAAHAWGRGAMEAGRPQEAVTAYTQAIAQLPAIVPRHLAAADAERALSEAPGLAGDAAACALAAGDAMGALGLLELGRGVLLGQGMKNHDELAELRARAPETADRLVRLRARLDIADGAGTSDERYATAAEWDRLLTDVRAMEGFEDFLLPPRPAELLPHGAHGPVVLVNVSRYRCDALVLDTAGLRFLPLPRLTLADVVARTTALLGALGRLQDTDGDSGLMARISDENAIDGHLRWLWDTITGPVLDALGITGAPGTAPPRVWWIPTGPLSVLPLHAAGHHREGAGRTVLDRTVSSYTPTVRALAQARRRAGGAAPSFLVAAVPQAPGARPLPGAAEEAAVLARMLPGALRLTGEAATRDAVVAGLVDHTWLHFCGHGTAEPATPSGSRLLVHDHLDHPLTVAGISRLDLPGAELAYLSACTTARTGLGVTDEALHLVGALRLAGFRHVVGTLWAIDDTVALRIAERVYEGLGAPRPVADRAAYAVRGAVRETRDRYPATPSLWAAHLHAGP